MSKLEQLKTMTQIVADTGDIEAISTYKPLDATTNPSLLLKAAALPQYQGLLKDAVDYAKRHSTSDQNPVSLATDKLATLIGKEILGIIEGRISTEVDARLSFDKKQTIEKARELIRLYEEADISRERVLIKIASTWEGIQAASVLQKEGINCNLTLLFSFEQAQACADAGAFLISPFVGRIYDWYCKAQGVEHIIAEEDPGVLSVRKIFDFYKAHQYQTIVMGASFRNTAQIEALAGCDRLTISPALLEELNQDQGTLEQKLSVPNDFFQPEPKLLEAEFRWALNNNAMANEKLGEGIRLFAQDQEKLEKLLTD